MHNSISHEKRHLQQSVKTHHGTLKNPSIKLLEMDAIKYQRSVGSWQNVTDGYKLRIEQYEKRFTK